MSTASPTPNPSLYELGEALTQAFAEVDAMLAASEGEYTPEMAAIIDAAEEAWQDKVIRTGYYADKVIPNHVAAIEEEQRRLLARKKALENRRRWLKETYLPEALRRHGRTSVDNALATLNIGEGRERVVCEVKASSLPRELQRHSVSVEVNKEAVLAAHKAGKPLPNGVRVEKKPVAKVK